MRFSLRASILLLAIPLFGSVAHSDARDPKQTRKVDGLTPLADFIEKQGVFHPDAGFTVFFEHEPTSGEYTGDVDIAASRLHISKGRPIWSARQSMPVSTSVYTESNVHAVSDGSGGWYVAYEATAKTGAHSGDTEVFAQRISADGKPLWHEGEKSVVVASTEWNERAPQVVPDGKGGMVLVYTMSTDIGEHAGDADIAAQRIDPDGKLLWGDGNGVPVTNSTTREENATALPTSDGGVLVVFQATPRTGDRAGVGGIFAQRISPDGRRVWNNGEHPSPVSLSAWSEESPRAISDGKDGAFVVFLQRALTGEHAGDLDLAIQRIQGDGTPAWNQGQSAPVLSDSLLLEREPALAPDGDGGVIVVFEAEPRTGDRAGNIDVWAQRVDKDGKRLWNDGSPLWVATSKWSEKNPQVISDGKGGVFVVFEQHGPRGEHAGDVDLAAQRILPDGTLAWHDGGAALDIANSPMIEINPLLISDGEGGGIVVYEALSRKGVHAGDRDLLAQRFSANGERIWNDGKSPSPVASSRLLERNAHISRP
jgi:hypothetical protein